MSAVNKTGKWDPVWVRISPRKPAAMNPEVALTASRVSSPAEDSRWRNFPVSGKSSLARVVPPDARGRLITVNPPRGPGGRWGRSGEKQATRGGDKSELLRHYITTSQRAGGLALMTLWWMADSGSIKIYGDGSQRAGNRTLAPAQKLLARGGFKGKGTSSCGDGNMLTRSEGSCRVHWSVCLLPIRCLTCGNPRRMDMSCKARPTRAMFLFSWNACVVRYA